MPTLRLEPTAYDILGVPRTASTDEVKRRYRELARASHPDVNPDNPNAAKLFAQITTAYKTLSDAQARVTYDSELALKERQLQQAAQRATAANGSRAANAASQGSGRTAAGPALQNPNSVEAQRLTSEAQVAFSRSKFIEARTKAEQALRLNRRNAAAYEIIGDVYRLQGKTDEAINMYTFALQYNQNNAPMRARLERLARVGTPTGSTSSGPTAERVFYDNRDASQRDRSGMRSGASPPRFSTDPVPPTYDDSRKRSIAHLLVGLIGYGGTLLTLLFLYQNHGDPMRPAFPLVYTWNIAVICCLALSGLLLGATMAITGVIRRIEDELLFSGGRGGSRLGPALILLGTLNLYVGFAVYTITSLLQESFTPTMQRVFGSIFLVTLLLALVYSPGTGQVLLWGGGIVFFSYIIGWVLGDVFRGD